MSKQVSICLSEEGVCNVHALAVLAMLDHHARRPQGQKTDDIPRVVGVLLGRREGNGVVVTDAFPAVHVINKTVLAFKNEMLDAQLKIHSKTSPADVPVGWYATSPVINSASVLLQRHFTKKLGADMNAVHLTVNPATGDIAAYVFSEMDTQSSSQIVGSFFRPLPVNVLASPMERVALSSVANAAVPDTAPLAELNELLTAAAEYAEKAASGEIVGDPETGRQILAVTRLLPLLPKAEVEKMYDNHVQNVLMASYVARQVREQVDIAERLRSILSRKEIVATTKQPLARQNRK